MGLLVGWVALSSSPARAQQAVLKMPEARRITVNFKETPFRKALEQVFAPGGLRVKLEADVPALPVTLTLKGVDPETAFRLLLRQAKKQEQDLQFEPIDDGYRIFLGKLAQADQDNPYPLTPQPKLPKPLAPPTPDFPVVQNREAEPFIGALLQRVEDGEELLPAPKGAVEESGLAGGQERVTYGTTGLGKDDFGGDPFGGNSFGDNLFGGNGLGNTGYGPSYGGFQGPSYGNSYGGFQNPGYGNEYGGFGGEFNGLGGLRQPRTVDPYSSPLAGGLRVADQISQGVYERKKKPLPSFYDHSPQWIMEPRTKYWGNGRRPSGKKAPPSGNGEPLGGGYAPR
jgi:hypothetical protein